MTELSDAMMGAADKQGISHRGLGSLGYELP